MNFDELLVTGASWSLGLGAGWAALLLVAAVVEVVSDGRVGRDFFELAVGEGVDRLVQAVPNSAVAALQGRR